MTEPLIEVCNLAGNDDLCHSAMLLWPPAPAKNSAKSAECWRAVQNGEQLLAAVTARTALAEYASGQPTVALQYVIHSDVRALRDNGSAGDAYFHDALAWLEQRHDRDNIVAATVLRDGPTPRLVVYAVPLTRATRGTKNRPRAAGAPPAWRLSAAPFLGSKALHRLQQDFMAQVAAPHGFAQPAPRHDDLRLDAGIETVFDLDIEPAEIDPLATLRGEIERLKLECEWAQDELQRAETAHGEQIEQLTRQLAEQKQENRHLAGLLACLSGEELTALAKRKRQHDLDKQRLAPQAKAEIVHHADQDIDHPQVVPMVDDEIDDWSD